MASPQAVRAEYASVLLQAKRYDEAADEYERLLSLDEDNAAYRLGLIRALDWGGRHREAERELRTLIRQRPADASLDSLLRSVRLSYEPRASEAAGWLAERPDYGPYRLALGRALARERRHEEAIAHLDTLVAQSRTAPLLIERARMLASRRRYDASRADLDAALAIAPSADAYVVLGDLHRWNGDLAAARSAYERARALEPQSRAVTTAFMHLTREERPPIAFTPVSTDALGWQLVGETVEDNAGMSYATLGARKGFDIGAEMVGSVGVEYRLMSERALDGSPSRRVQVAVVDAGASHLFSLGRIGGRAGVALHPGAATVPYGSVSGVGWIWTWNLSLEVAVAPAYPTLLTLASLLPSDAGAGRPLSGESATVTLAGPIGATDVAVSGQHTRLGDGNLRSTMQAFVRHPLDEYWSFLYSASSIRFDERSALYWDPASYLAHGAGVEVADREPRGFSYAVRVLPGVARSEEAAPFDAPQPGVIARSYVFQLGGGGDWSYRAERWEVGAALAYGRGRAGGYERMNANVYLRLVR
jgi:tetratricopeptide (TPR) repeat protein